MAQFIRTPVEVHPDFWNEATQISQVVYRNQRVITIDYEQATNRIIVHDNGELFYLTSPDIQDITMLQTLQHLGYGNEQIVITFADNNQPDGVLNSPVRTATLNQIALYGPNDVIPEVHPVGPFPIVVPDHNEPDAPNPNDQIDFGPFQGVDAPNHNDDDNSTISDIPNFNYVEHFGDSDDDDEYRYRN
jgi:hypothetical protein